MRGIKIPQQEFALKMQRGLICTRWGGEGGEGVEAYLRDTMVCIQQAENGYKKVYLK